MLHHHLPRCLHDARGRGCIQQGAESHRQHFLQSPRRSGHPCPAALAGEAEGDSGPQHWLFPVLATAFRDSLMSHVFGFKLVLASEAKDVGETS